VDDADVGDCTAAPDDCTLRGSIPQAQPGDFITFDSSVFSPGTIFVQSPLPPLSQGTVTIEGNCGLWPIVDGSQAGVGVDGLTLTSDGNFVRRLRIRNFDGHGVLIDGGAGNTLGGDACSRDLIVTENGGYGIRITGETADGNLIRGSYIGVDDSVTAFGNGQGGVLIDGGRTAIVCWEAAWGRWWQATRGPVWWFGTRRRPATGSMWQCSALEAHRTKGLGF
jgi:hypothetical protein